jgi:xeroderma pigmentosum group C-complementing protein
MNNTHLSVHFQGKIPRNEFGNVYMYRPEMVPKSCVHLRLPGVFQIARRMEIDAVPAVVGWQFAGCQNVPILDGCVIAQQDEEVLRAAWRETNCAKAAQKAKRTSERVWANWRRLIRAKTILERIRRQFSS